MLHKIFAGIGLAIFFVACSLPERGALNDVQRDLDERNKLVGAYEGVQGVYEGVIELSGLGRTTPARLVLTYREVPVGTDNDGQIRYRPRLLGRLDQPEELILNERLEGVFEPVTGDITLSSLQGQQAKDSADAYYFRTTLSGDRIVGDLRLGAQIYGRLNVTRTSVNLPDETDEFERLRQIVRNKLQVLEGDYEALITPTRYLVPGIGLGPFIASTFQIRIRETGREMPKLILYYKGPEKFMVVQSVIEYTPGTQPEEISFSVPRGQGLQESFEFFGTFEQGVIEGEIVYPTFVGTLRAVKK